MSNCNLVKERDTVAIISKAINNGDTVETTHLTPKGHKIRGIKVPNSSYVKSCTAIQAAIDAHKSYPDAKIVLLDFADYYEPAKSYLDDNIADLTEMTQEAHLCYTTDLYYQLQKNKAWYARHNNTMYSRKGLYLDDNMLIPNVTIIASDVGKYLAEKDRFTVSVLVVAPPNWVGIMHYAHGNMIDAYNATTNRIYYIAEALEYLHYDVAILGAFGCGIAENDEKEVVRAFKVSLNTYKIAKKVIFAVPRSHSEKNYCAFSKVFQTSVIIKREPEMVGA